MTTIAPTATVDPQAEIGCDVTIAPGCTISSGAVIGDGCELKANVFVGPGVVMGRENRIFQNCVIGEEPQMLNQTLGFNLVIGDKNVIRENCTISLSTADGNEPTQLGNSCYLMTGVHVGHDTHIGDEVVLCNAVQLGGFVQIEKKAWLAPMCGIQQFTTIGQYAYIGALSAVSHDVPPYVRVAGSYPCRVHGINLVGLQRAGFSKASIQAIHKVYLALYKRRGKKVFSQVLDELMTQTDLEVNARYFVEALHRSTQHHLGRYRELSR